MLSFFSSVGILYSSYIFHPLELKSAEGLLTEMKERKTTVLLLINGTGLSIIT